MTAGGGALVEPEAVGELAAFSICEECWRWPDEQAPGHIVLIVEPGYEETAERFRRWQAGERDAADDNA